MLDVSIICLIYKSHELADRLYTSLLAHTPMLLNGRAEFFFVANDPTPSLINHLVIKGYPFILNHNKHITDEELFESGFGKPEYISRVYKGYNQGIVHAKAQKIVLLNSDNFLSPDWLENLLKYSDANCIISSQLIEPGHEKFGTFPTAIQKNFGNSVSSFNESEFIKYSYKIKKTGIKEGGAYMPCLFFRNMAIFAGLYPEGNICDINFETITKYGDEFFYEKMKNIGVNHFTAEDSIVYHLKEGERDSVDKVDQSKDTQNGVEIFVTKSLNKIPDIQVKNIHINLLPDQNHSKIISELLNLNQGIITVPLSLKKKIIRKLKRIKRKALLLLSKK